MSLPADDSSSPQRRPPTLAPLVFGAAFATMAIAAQTKIAAWLCGFMRIGEQPGDAFRRRLDAGWTLERLRDSILGRHKTVLLTRYGAPRAAALNRVVLTGADSHAGSALRADTWYYLLDPANRTAMSVRFHGSVAVEVEFFDSPNAG
jgi:hypothetical protein